LVGPRYVTEEQQAAAAEGFLLQPTLPEKIYLDAQREFEPVQAAIGVLGKLDIWGCGR
jgi:hypothetical protein